ncbi:MAG: LysR family transcriptional regulator [Lachnospiraceae bacterium]|nr:LysR family transcriptional regulator [Lachnospiraceae bacterium]
METRVEAKVILRNEHRFFGPGIQELLLRIDECGSVKQACQEMGLSYTKGWRILKTAETAFGFALVDRRQGGRGGGAASLTQEARDITERYLRLQLEISAYAEEKFSEHFPELKTVDPYPGGEESHNGKEAGV